jgi:hypothetical protein
VLEMRVTLPFTVIRAWDVLVVEPLAVGAVARFVPEARACPFDFEELFLLLTILWLVVEFVWDTTAPGRTVHHLVAG